MSDVPILLKGWLLGFAIAAPVGPIGVLCIRRTLADGRLIGFLSGLGSARPGATSLPPHCWSLAYSWAQPAGGCCPAPALV